VSVPAACIGVILIWSTTPLAIQWSGDEVGFLFGITSRMVLGMLAGLLLFEYGQQAGKRVRDTMTG
jgi:CRISPR/Cas system CMR subunit Cmr4 (Cas7 group RAMP superfamily)